MLRRFYCRRSAPPGCSAKFAGDEHLRGFAMRRSLVNLVLSGWAVLGLVGISVATAGEPLRVTPAVQTVTAGQGTASVQLAGWRHGYWGGGFYGGGWGGWGGGYRSWGGWGGPAYGAGYYGYRPYSYYPYGGYG